MLYNRGTDQSAWAGKSVWAAPLAGVTDKAFRRVIQELTRWVGLANLDFRVLSVTEMISCHALHYNNRHTLAMLDLSGEPEPRTVQIFGADPSLMAEAAKRVVELGASAVNINMGCPVPKIVNNGEGSALLKDMGLAVDIAGAVVKSVGPCVPVSVKMRLGWDGDHLVASELAPRLERSGVAALMVHGRTRDQFYAGRADWQGIARVKESVGIPVIGNGDIHSPEDAVSMLEQTGCDGVMVGRAMLGNPWMLIRTAAYVQQGCLLPELPPVDKLRVIRRHFELLVRYKGEDRAVKEMRKHALWYTKGIQGAAQLRERMVHAQSVEELEGVLEVVFPVRD
ncbi:MAG: tRNA dihydrouridine synthase DusB [Peptococcaceae bacterium]|nr:tRNA dihydrouridine synthase DusB [Peptococcaceae bacterium]